MGHVEERLERLVIRSWAVLEGAVPPGHDRIRWLAAQSGERFNAVDRLRRVRNEIAHSAAPVATRDVRTAASIAVRVLVALDETRLADDLWAELEGPESGHAYEPPVLMPPPSGPVPAAVESAVASAANDIDSLLRAAPIPPRELDLAYLGHRSAITNGTVAPWVQRTVTPQLVARIEQAASGDAEGKRLVSVLGPSKAGKSRLIAEALRLAQLPDGSTLLQPRVGKVAELSNVLSARRGEDRLFVVWIDDIHHQLGREVCTAADLLQLAGADSVLAVITCCDLSGVPLDPAMASRAGIDAAIIDLLRRDHLKLSRRLDDTEFGVALAVMGPHLQRASIPGDDVRDLACVLASIDVLVGSALDALERREEDPIRAAIVDALIITSQTISGDISTEEVQHLASSIAASTVGEGAEKSVADEIDSWAKRPAMAGSDYALVQTTPDTMRILDAVRSSLQRHWHPTRAAAESLTSEEQGLIGMYLLTPIEPEPRWSQPTADRWTVGIYWLDRAARRGWRPGWLICAMQAIASARCFPAGDPSRVAMTACALEWARLLAVAGAPNAGADIVALFGTPDEPSLIEVLADFEHLWPSVVAAINVPAMTEPATEIERHAEELVRQMKALQGETEEIRRGTEEIRRGTEEIRRGNEEIQRRTEEINREVDVIWRALAGDLAACVTCEELALAEDRLDDARVWRLLAAVFGEPRAVEDLVVGEVHSAEDLVALLRDLVVAHAVVTARRLGVAWSPSSEIPTEVVEHLVGRRRTDASCALWTALLSVVIRAEAGEPLPGDAFVANLAEAERLGHPSALAILDAAAAYIGDADGRV